ncbi:bifunctional ADP-dependent NAD(P)H-hydrate dehydratase/NAD(P)H-hydrate epimerase [Bacillus massilinigeriensis]|uniref:bifunctional ADP-dependent NAD(P)H-hydrate dehydratase/NAD(P)H-hydrate epimerase n=1 Tax=Bacillus massilionigeriensis TaxID=1805475 RepID=UPI00096B67C4|nr:bifunctional ADP-dependent NAD(P)H-hydrate dehydratase/NAD(P)H-hydrate epimerase [Bacillus massilionigeriensis]
MFVAGQREMQQMDRYTMDNLGLPGIVLMENAGAKVVEEIIKCSPSKDKKVAILAGGGNNGGDGFVIARRLFDQGFKPLLCLLAKPEIIKGDAKCHLDVYLNRGLPVFHLPEKGIEALRDELNSSDVIIDAILGTGVKGPVRDPFSQVITLVNSLEGRKLIISVDIPSGVSSDDGKVEGAAIKASKTITFVFPKKGFFLNDGPNYVGEWKAVDISVPPFIAEELHMDLPQLITEQLARQAVPKRPSNGHKGTFGHAVVVGGSRPYVGAPIYAAKAVLNSGAGLVTLAIPESIYPMAATQNPESLFLPLSDSEGHFAMNSVEELSSKLHQFDCVAVGPGMSRFPGGEKWMVSLLDALTNQPIVIDADAIFLLRNELNRLQNYKGTAILTPHPGEMAHLLNVTIKEIEENRLNIARDFAKKYQVFLLLKGHRSIIASPSGEVYINPFGHDALGKGGSGDVLTGLIASFLAQSAPPIHSLILASYLHARAGEEQAKILSHYGVMPLDVIDWVKGELLNLLEK